MLDQAFEGSILIALTVLIHAVGSAYFLWVLNRYGPFWERHFGFVVNVLSLTWVVGTLVCLHLTEIVAWAAFYWRRGVLPTFEVSAYYSLVTYTTVGYGDVVLPVQWRLLGGCEAVVGILMAAWSTALLLGVVNKVHLRQFGARREPENSPEP